MNNPNFRQELQQQKYESLGISFTEKAQEMALRAVSADGEEGLFIRVGIRGGGCSGLQYNLDIDDKLSDYDVVCQINGLKIASDIFSLHYLANTTVDYQESLQGAGFKFNNPSARTTCGCGSSFSR